MQQLIYEFLLESIMPGFREKVRKHDTEEILKLVIGRAHKDVMIGARYKTSKSSENYCEHNEDYQKLAVDLIMADPSQLSGRKIIESIYAQVKNINIGLIQKLVNMSIKYLCVIRQCEIDIGTELQIVESDCDCPLDSRILEQLVSDTGKKKYTAWTKLDNWDEYKDIQKDIQDVIESDITKYIGKSRLEYDFVNWGLPIEKDIF